MIHRERDSKQVVNYATLHNIQGNVCNEILLLLICHGQLWQILQQSQKKEI